MVDFSLPPDLVSLRERTLAFIRDEVVPLEAMGDEHGEIPADRLEALRERAREAGLFAPAVPQRWGGLGLDMRGISVVFEAAGRSLLGPLALNCAAPDEGNMHLLETVASDEQKDHY